MADSSAPWEGQLIGDATAAPYSSLEWAHFWALRHALGAQYLPTYGILEGTGGGGAKPLAVLATNPVSAAVELQVGTALVNGRLYENDAALTLSVSANSSGNPRIDAVILRVDYVAQTVTPVVKQGSPAVSPVAPTLQQDTSIWEMALAYIAVANGFSTIATTDITSLHRYANLTGLGWQPYALPENYTQNVDPNNDLTFTNFFTIVMPVVLHANLLLDNLTMNCTVNAGTVTVRFDIYMQDLNNGNSAQNSLYRVAHGQAAIAAGTDVIRSIPATNTPIALPPGCYWVAIQQNDAGANQFALHYGILASAFQQTNSKSKNTGAANGQTLDLVAATWTAYANRFWAVRLEGRVFGQTTAYA